MFTRSPFQSQTCLSTPPLALASVSRYFRAAAAKTYVVTFRSHNNDRPSKFIVVANDRKSAIKMAWEHGGPDFQSRFDKSTDQAQEMKEGALRVWEARKAVGCLWRVDVIGKEPRGSVPCQFYGIARDFWGLDLSRTNKKDQERTIVSLYRSLWALQKDGGKG